MARRSIKGLFVAVELDQTKLTEGVKAAVSTLKTEFENAKDSINKSLKLDAGGFEEVLSDVAKSINRIQNAIRTKTGGEAFSEFIKDSDELKKSLEEVATQAGVSSEIVRDSLSKAVKANQVKETVSAVRALGYTLNLSSEQLVQYAKDLGVSGEALERITAKHEKANSRISEVTEELKKLTGKDVTLSESELAGAKSVENTQKLVRNFKEYVQLMELSNDQALEHAQKLGLSGDALKKITEKYKDSISVADKELEKLVSKIGKLTGRDIIPNETELNKAIQVDKVKQLVDLMGQYKSALNLSNNEVVEHARKLGYANEALRSLRQEYTSLGNKAKAELSEIAKDITKLTGVKFLSGTSAEFASAEQVAKTNKIVELVTRYARMLDLSEQEVRELGKQLNLTARQMEKLVGEAGKLSEKTDGFLTGIKNLMTGGNAMAALQSSLATLGANISIAGFTELGKSMMDTSIKVDSLRTAFTSIYKDADRAAVQLDYIRSVTDELGLEFYSTAEAAKGFFAAAETSVIKGNAEDIFRAFSSASSALKMTQEQTNGVFLAISQMMSKGKISAEEMRQQLAERLPGAVQLLADSMGVTLQQLDKMFESGEVGVENLVKFAEKVEEVYGEAGVAASKALLGEMNKLKSAWTDFKSEFISTGEVIGIIKNLQDAVMFLKENMQALRKVVNSLITAFLSFVSLKAVQHFVQFSAGVLNATKSVANFVKGITSLRAALTALSASLSMVTFGLSAIVGVGVYVWQSMKDGSEGAKYSVDDFRKGIDLTISSVVGVGNAAKSASAELRRLAAIRVEENLKKSQEQLKGVEASFKNVSSAILNVYAEIGEGVKRVSMSVGQTGKQEFLSFDKNELGDILKTVTTGLNYFDKELKEGRITSSYITKEFKNWQNKAKELGPQGEKLYQYLVNLEKIYLEAIVENNKALEERNKLLGEMSKKTPPENFETTSLTSSKYALESIKKQAKNRGDFELVETINLAMSSDLENSKTGEIQKKSAREILDIVRSLNVEEKDLAYALQLRLGLSQEMVEVVKENARISKEKAAAPNVEKLKKYKVELESVNSRWEDMQKASQLGVDSVDYAIYKVEDWAKKAKKEIDQLYGKMRSLDSKMAEEYKTKAYALVDSEALAKQEKALLRYLEKGKAAYARFEEAKTGAHKIEVLTQDYNKALRGLDEYLNAMLKKYKDNAEKQKEVVAEVEKYREALTANYEKDKRDASKNGLDIMAKEWEEFYNQSMDWGSQLSSSLTGMVDTLSNSFIDMVTTGAASFKDFASSIVKDLSRIATKLFLVWTIEQALGWVGSLGGSNGKAANVSSYNFTEGSTIGSNLQLTPVKGFHNGGLVGSAGTFTRAVPSSLFANAPRFHSGTGYVRPGEYPAILKAGERVLNPSETQAYQRGGVVNNINISTPSGYEAQESRTPNSQGGEDVQISFIRKVVAGDMGSYGSQINRAMRAQGSRLPVMRGGG